MKKILFIIFFTSFVLWVMLSGCSKAYDPCGKAVWITQIYADSSGHWIKDDTTWQTGSVVCGEQFKDYQIEESQNSNKRITRHCINGETIYWERHIIKTY